MPNLNNDASYFLKLQTQTGWGHILNRFADWCAPQSDWHVLDIGTGPGLFPAMIQRSCALAFGCDLDLANFTNPLHPHLIAADVFNLPFSSSQFNLVTASNLLFLLPEPKLALNQIHRITQPEGQICLLNPSENMSVTAATELADKNELTGLARDTLINYAERAERHARWSTEALNSLFDQAGFVLIDTTLAMGKGLIRFVKGIKL